MSSNDWTLHCVWCERFIEPSRLPHGIAWLCICGHWRVRFFIRGRTIELENGNEELAIQYLGKIVKMLKSDSNVS